MKRVRVAELKNNLSRYLRAVEAGAEVEVADRERPIARLVPIARPRELPIRPPTRPFAAVRDRVYPSARLPVDSVELLLEERQGR